MMFFNRQIQVFSQPAGYGYAYAPVGEKFSLVSKRTYDDPRLALNDACLDAACGHVVSSDGIAIASTTKGRCLCASNLANKVFKTNLVGQEISGFYQDPSRRVKIIKALEQQGFLFELIDFIDADGKPLNFWLAIRLVQLPVDTLLMSTLQDNNTPLPFSRAFLKPW